MALQPRLSRRVHWIGEKEHPAVDGQHDGDEAHQAGGQAARGEHGSRHRHIGDGPEAHVDEEVAIGTGAWVLGEYGHPHREHGHGDREEDAEVAQEEWPAEGSRRDLVRRAAPAPLDLVAHRLLVGGHARLERGGRAPIHTDDAVAPLERNAGLNGEHAIVRGDEETRIRSSHARRQRTQEERESCRREADHDECARVSADHLSPDHTRGDIMSGLMTRLLSRVLTAETNGSFIRPRWTLHRATYRRRRDRYDLRRRRRRTKIVPTLAGTRNVSCARTYGGSGGRQSHPPPFSSQDLKRALSFEFGQSTRGI